MNRKFIWIIAILAIIAIGFGIYFFNNTRHNSSNYDASRLSTNSPENTNNVQNNFDRADINNASDNFTTNNTTTNNASSNKQNNNQTTPPKKTQEKKKTTQSERKIASFTTKIYTKDSERQNNIDIACSTLNNTLVKNGDTFSFTSTVGKATSGKGYEKADVFKDGDKIKALGGGLCQVSSTLYNAVLKVSSLDITERHSHSNYVPYVKKGKDAAVAYGSYDFKFVNNTGNTIKIKASNSKDYVTVKILKLE